MRRRSSKKKSKVIILIIIMVIIFLFGGYYRLTNNYLQLIRLKREISILKAENEVLRLRVAQYQTDKKIVERFARDRLGMKKPGESVILIIGNDK